MSAKNARHYHACVLPKGSRYLLWVQSPNEQWMLLSGAWNTELGAKMFATKAGYQLDPNRHEVLNQIERQMEVRAGERPVDLSH